MNLNEIKPNTQDVVYARRTDWEDDKIMAKKINNSWNLLHPIFMTPISSKNRTVSLDCDKWEESDIHGNFLKEV